MSALTEGLRATYGCTDGVCALAEGLLATYGCTDEVCALAGSTSAAYGHGGFKLRWRGRNCRLRLRSGLRFWGCAWERWGGAPNPARGAAPDPARG